MSQELAKQTPNIQQLLEARKDAIAKVLPKHLSADRLIRIALVTIGKNPALQKCSQSSLVASMLTAAQLGLDIGGALGHAYLVPYGNDAQLIIGYRGMIDLARRSGEIVSIEARVVWQNDKFDIAYSLDGPQLTHVPALDVDPGEFRLVYAIAKLRDGGIQFELMTRAQIDAVRSRSRSKNNGPWVTDYPEMARKTIVKRLFKYLPVSIELADAVDDDTRREFGDTVDSVVVSAPSANDLNKKLATPPKPMPKQIAATPPAPSRSQTNDPPTADIEPPPQDASELAAVLDDAAKDVVEGESNLATDSPDDGAPVDANEVWLDEASDSFQSFAQGMHQIAIQSMVETAQAKKIIDALKLTGLNSAKRTAKDARRAMLAGAKLGKFNWRTGVLIEE